MTIYSVTVQRAIVEVVMVEANDDDAAKGLALYGYGVPVGIPQDASKPKLLECRELSQWPETLGNL